MNIFEKEVIKRIEHIAVIHANAIDKDGFVFNNNEDFKLYDYIEIFDRNRKGEKKHTPFAGVFYGFICHVSDKKLTEIYENKFEEEIKKREVIKK